MTCSLQMGRLINTMEGLICLETPQEHKTNVHVWPSEVLFIEASITPRYSKIRPVSSARTPAEAKQRRDETERTGNDT